ncbi:PAS domain-containing sensor histidine kinase [Pelovirga terrestris]|uniref:histidine kinase n=1 Tax=Pelovirga terrestris TaxID=2771352 RepID=A0A8J6QV42_9BACT|nr:sensor histidine kinase [Pelovirga terrestris]MBD1401210.1 PAS domain S-box protein [Pelovirga terrestris]
MRLTTIAGLLTVSLFILPLPGHTEPLSALELFRQHRAMILLIDPGSGQIIDANEAAVAYYGYPYEQLLELNIQQINSLGPVATEQEIRRADREQRAYFAFHHRLANGDIRPVEVYSSPLDIDGHRLLASIIHDASDRENLQENIVQSESRLRYAEQVAGLGHWTLDLEHNSYRFSEGAMELLGLDHPVQPVPSLRQMILPDQRAHMIAAHERLVRQGIPYNVHFRFERPDGLIIDLNSQGVYNARENQVFGILHDITDTQEAMRRLSSRTAFFNRLAVAIVIVLLGIVALLYYAVRRSKDAEAALKTSKAKLQENFEMTELLLDSTAEGIYGIDRRGICTFCNSAALKLLGYRHREELVGHNIHDRIHHSHADGTRFPAEECTLLVRIDEQLHREEELLWCADGSIIPTEFWSYPMRRNGDTIGAVVTFLDISERKAQQAALQSKNQEMENFVYSVSHDLKSPLVTIKSFLRMLQQDLQEQNQEQIDEDLRYINGAAERMDNLLAGLLQLSRIGRLEGQPHAVDVARLVAETLVSLSGLLQEKEIKVRVDDIPHQLYGDPMRLGQIWQNLIENAGKYVGDQPQPQIDIGVEEKNGVTTFFIRDNGIGIDQQHAQRIFALFAQLDPQSPGSGIGLPMVKKIVELYQGRVWFESEGKDQGSCFYFTLPKALKPHEEKP